MLYKLWHARYKQNVHVKACYVGGNGTPTLPWPYEIGDRDGAVADTSAGRGNGSWLYELNVWMWAYGRGHPRKVS